MAVHIFEDFDVWQKTYALVLGIYQLTKRFPDEEKFALVSQVRRSAVSISVNIVEAGRKAQGVLFSFWRSLRLHRRKQSIIYASAGICFIFLNIAIKSNQHGRRVGENVVWVDQKFKSMINYLLLNLNS